MGDTFLINKNGSVSHYPMVKVINNIERLDYKQDKGKYMVTQFAFLILCIFPIYGQLIYLLTSLLYRMRCGFDHSLGLELKSKLMSLSGYIVINLANWDFTRKSDESLRQNLIPCNNCLQQITRLLF